MKTHNGICLGIVSALALALALAGCQKQDKGGPETILSPSGDKGVLTGTLRLTGGKPAANATVRFYTVDHLPGNAATGSPKVSATQDYAFSTRTDSLGRYGVDSLPRGEYNILGEKDGEVFYRDSVFLSPGTKTVVVDSLGAAGSISGTVDLQPNHDLRTVVVHVLGTNAFSNVDVEGRFTLRAMASGRYSLKIETGLDQYAPLYTGLTVHSGSADTLVAKLPLPFTGIPVVQGLKVELDTLAGVARISWNKADYRHFKSFVVLRNERDPLVPGSKSIAVTRDTFFVDSLFKPGADDFELPSGDFSKPIPLEYKVRIRNQSEVEGEIYGSAPLDAVPPSWAQSFTELQFPGQGGSEASLHDTLKVVALFRNKTRALSKVLWRMDGVDGPVRDVTLKEGSHSGSDTLTLVGDRLGVKRFYCQLVDDANHMWTFPGSVAFIASPPVANAGSDTAVWRGAKVRLRGNGTTRFGRIVKMEWDVGRTGTFKETIDGSVEFTAPAEFSVIPCAFRVTNDDGETNTAVRTINVTQVWEKRATNLPMRGDFGQTVFWKGKVWIIGGLAGSSSGSLFSSTDGEIWKTETPSPEVTDRVNFKAVVFQNKLYVLGGNNRETGEYQTDIRFTEDGITWASEIGPYYALIPRIQTSVAAFKDQLWLFSGYGNGTQYWSSLDANAWTPFYDNWRPGFDFQEGYSVTTFSGKMVIAGNASGISSSTDGLNWTFSKIGNHFIGKQHSTVVSDGRLWFIGGNNAETSATYAEINNGDLEWHSGPSFPEPIGAGNISFTINNNLWVIYNGTLWCLR